MPDDACTLRPCGVILDDLNPFNYVSQEDCMKREVLEFRKALSDSMLNELDGAMGKVSDLDSCFSQVPPSL